MSNSITQPRNTSLRLTSIAGALASLLTQPFEVMKTNRINTPATVYLDLHRQIVSTGWKTYMKGRYEVCHLVPLQWLGRLTVSLFTRSYLRDWKIRWLTLSQISIKFVTTRSAQLRPS